MFDWIAAAGAFEPVGAAEPVAETGEGVGAPLGEGEGEGEDVRMASSIAALTDA